MKNNINSPKLKEGLKGIRTLIIFGIIFFLLTIGLIIWIYLVKIENTALETTDVKLQTILITITSMFTLIFLLTALVNKTKTNKKINKFTPNEWNLIEED